jgi:nucleoside-diphosphate-sugar epimerase
MKCLVTGGAGFIGSHLAEGLLAEDHQVRILDNLSTGSVKNVAMLLNKGATYLPGDIRNGKDVFNALDGIDMVYHLAALPRVVRSVQDPVGTHDTNVTGFLNILQACRQLGIYNVVYASSSSVYGTQGTHVMDENMTPHPMSPYALHKVMNEQYARMFYDLFSVSSIGLRFFNVYGERQSTEGAYALVIGKFLRMKEDNEPLTIFGDGNQTRDYTHVSDVVRAIIMSGNALLGIERDSLRGAHKFNVGTGVETSINEIAQLVTQDRFNYPVNHVIPNPRGDFEELRKQADIFRTSAFIGWKPSVGLEEGIRRLLV